MSQQTWSYDAIAEVYATDMGQSMPFDDIGCYANLAQRYPGPLLELGCGTGRILLELLAQGRDAIGVDRSLPMLRRLLRDAEDIGVAAHVAQMDLRALAVSARFALVLAPYSLITYLTEPSALEDFMRAGRGLLADGGALVLDAFVPRDVAPFDDFRLDYRRQYGDGSLERAKRIACLADGCNRIERRYRLIDADETIREEFVTVDCIRPFAPEQLRQLAQRHDLSIAEELWDYGASDDPTTARFYTLIAVKPA